MITYLPESDKYDFDTNVSIEDIKKSFEENNSGSYFSMFETGLNGLRFDLIRIDPYKKYIRIFEFKSSRSDFASDKKWQKYLKYCHTFTFVCPREIIQKDDLPKGIGLMWVYKWRWRENILKSGRWYREQEWIKKPRVKEVDIQIMLGVAFMLLHRVRWRSNDIF